MAITSIKRRNNLFNWYHATGIPIGKQMSGMVRNDNFSYNLGRKHSLDLGM